MIDTVNTVAKATETKAEARKKASKHEKHRALMLEHLQRKNLRRASHKALITHFLTPKKLKSIRG